LLPAHETFGANILPYSPEMALVISRSLVLVRPDYSPNELDQDEFEQLSSEVGAFLKRLRHVSGQAGMPREEDLMVMQSTNIDELPNVAALECHNGQMTVQTYSLTTSVTRANVEAASGLPDDFSAPIGPEGDRRGLRGTGLRGTA
jgi:hypothetical protein